MRYLHRLAVTALALAAIPGAALGLLTRTASAQDGAKAAVRIAPVILAEPDIETPLAIQVGPEEAVPKQSFLRIRGLPASAKLSDGHAISTGAWAVPLASLAGLKVIAPVAGSGRAELSIALVSVEGNVLAETKSSLVVAPAWLLGASTAKGQDVPRPVPAKRPDQAVAGAPAPKPEAEASGEGGTRRQPPATAVQTPAPLPEKTQTLAALPPAAAAAPAPSPLAQGAPVQLPVIQFPPSAVAAIPPAPAAKAPPVPAAKAAAPAQTAQPPVARPGPLQLSDEDAKRAERLVQQGETYLSQGNLAAARNFFLRAAEIGLARGALRMAATYDPAELNGIVVQGLQPDVTQARKWYERARELGAPEAASRISRLEGR